MSHHKNDLDINNIDEDLIQKEDEVLIKEPKPQKMKGSSGGRASAADEDWMDNLDQMDVLVDSGILSQKDFETTKKKLLDK